MTTMPKTADPTPDLAARAGTPLADYLAGVLRGLRPLPPMDIDLTQAYGNVLASDVVSPSPLPAFDHAAIDGYAARCEDLGDTATGKPVRLNVVGDLVAASWRPVRLSPGTCFSVAAGAPLPAGADVVVPVAATDQGMAVVEVYSAPKRGHGLRRAGDELPAGSVLARSGAYVTPALVSILAACGVGHVVVRPSPRVVVIATGDELVDVGRASQPGQVVAELVAGRDDHDPRARSYHHVADAAGGQDRHQRRCDIGAGAGQYRAGGQPVAGPAQPVSALGRGVDL